MKNEMIYESPYGTHNVVLYAEHADTVVAKGCLHISLYSEDEEYGGYEPFGDVTLVLRDQGQLAPDEAYIDTNNMPGLMKFIEKYELGRPAGKILKSGFCMYPLYKFDLGKLKELDESGNM